MLLSTLIIGLCTVIIPSICLIVPISIIIVIFITNKLLLCVVWDGLLQQLIVDYIALNMLFCIICMSNIFLKASSVVDQLFLSMCEVALIFIVALTGAFEPFAKNCFVVNRLTIIEVFLILTLNLIVMISWVI